MYLALNHPALSQAFVLCLWLWCVKHSGTRSLSRFVFINKLRIVCRVHTLLQGPILSPECIYSALSLSLSLSLSLAVAVNLCACVFLWATQKCRKHSHAIGSSLAKLEGTNKTIGFYPCTAPASRFRRENTCQGRPPLTDWPTNRRGS